MLITVVAYPSTPFGPCRACESRLRAERKAGQLLKKVERVFRIDRESAVRAARREFPHYHLDGEVSRPRIETIIELQKDLGAIDRELSADDVLDLRFLRAA